MNNPVRFIDPDGMMTYDWTAHNNGNEGQYLDDNGSVMSSSAVANYFDFTRSLSSASVSGNGGGSGVGASVTYDQAIAFLYFGNINFSQFGDDITVNKNGNVSKIIRNNKPNRFFDESGIQLFFNDPESVDKNARNKKYDVGDQAYYQINRDEFLTAISKVSKNDLIISLLIQAKTGNIVIAPGAQIAAYGLIAAQSVMGDADFSAHCLSRKLDLNGTDVYQNNSSYHFRFGSTNTIYSLMDAGNFMWGGWSKFIGLFGHEVLVGSNLNEILDGHLDSKADQRAIFNGRKFITTGR